MAGIEQSELIVGHTRPPVVRALQILSRRHDPKIRRNMQPADQRVVEWHNMVDVEPGAESLSRAIDCLNCSPVSPSWLSVVKQSIITNAAPGVFVGVLIVQPRRAGQ